MFSRLKQVLLGEPLHSQAEHAERLTVPIGLAIFAADALSSTAYATEEVLIALSVSAFSAYSNLLSLPVSLAIAMLIAIVVLSYRQVIRAYPEGGGAYMVARANLGPLASQIAASALLIDYVLTVAVSISAGVAAFTSTGLFPHEHTVSLALILIVFIMLMNLRGVRESGLAFALPAYIFLAGMACMLLTGFYQVFTGQAPQVAAVAGPHTLDWTALGMNLAIVLALLNAFSHGCAALTGIEAVSNGVKAFKEPSDARANLTMTLMGVLLSIIFLGATYLAFAFHVMPKVDETIISQVARTVFGGQNFFYYLVQFSTMVMLILAANTSFAGFPRLSSMLARDGLLPRQLMSLGDRLVFSNGIVLLGLLSAILIVAFHGDTHSLIPLYAVGVFLSFTLAQTGMVVHHRRNETLVLEKQRLEAEKAKTEAAEASATTEPTAQVQPEPDPAGPRQDTLQQIRYGIIVNSFGAFVTGMVTLILIYEKFGEGAWIILAATPLLIILFRSIYDHYQSVGKQLALPETGYCPVHVDHTVLVLVSSLNRGTIPALEYAKTISDNVEAVHVRLNPAGTERLQKSWNEWGCGIPLTILDSPYRSLVEPLLDYVDVVEARYDHDLVTIIVPEFVTRKWWHNLLHNQTALLLKALLRNRQGKVVTTVRYHLEE